MRSALHRPGHPPLTAFAPPYAEAKGAGGFLLRRGEGVCHLSPAIFGAWGSALEGWGASLLCQPSPSPPGHTPACSLCLHASPFAEAKGDLDFRG